MSSTVVDHLTRVNELRQAGRVTTALP